MKKSLGIRLAFVICTLTVAGCAGRQYVDEGVAAAREELQQQIDAVKRDVNALKKSDAVQNGQITTLSETAGEALTRAREAGALAKGKFLYEIRFSDDAVKFATDSKALSPEARAALDAFAARLKAENRNVFIEIQGHTDSTGPEKHNLRLGMRRARAAARYLYMAGGVPLHRMRAISYGESKPMADNATPEGRAQNRCITLVVME